MEIARLDAQRRFSPEKMQKVPVFVSDKLFFDQYCLLPGQFQKVHTHGGEDKIYVVLEGEAVFDVGGETARLEAGHAVLARAGVAHGVRNDTDDRVVLLVAMAPRP
jgi:quercetin dioxygenase-like cupin family protein